MSDENIWTQHNIAERAEIIRRRMDNIVTIYGLPFDVTNSDHVILAAYNLAEMDGIERTPKRYGTLLKLFGNMLDDPNERTTFLKKLYRRPMNKLGND